MVSGHMSDGHIKENIMYVEVLNAGVELKGITKNITKYHNGTVKYSCEKTSKNRVRI